jgi:hypothetical protein
MLHCKIKGFICNNNASQTNTICARRFVNIKGFDPSDFELDIYAMNRVGVGRAKRTRKDLVSGEYLKRARATHQCQSVREQDSLLEYTSVNQISEPLCVSLLNGSLGAPMIRHGAVNMSPMW